jgi:uncharacterized GH25 family protein
MRSLQSRNAMLGFVLNSAAVLLLTVSCYQYAFGADDLIIAGKVMNGAGKPIADATVMVYHAGPTTGYSLFCPSCYADCGKRAITDTKGTFSFHHLRAGLWFELLVARSGYQPKFVEKVVPASDAPVTATLHPRPRVSAPNRIFRGRIMDSSGLAQRNAVVQSVGALWDAKTGGAIGVIPGLDPIAVTDSEGGFEIDSFFAKPNRMPSFNRPPVKILVSAEARGMAEAFSVIPAGLEPHAITVADGAVVRGRLVQDGKPIGGAEVGLFDPRSGWGPNFKMVGSPYGEIRIGTRPDGTFEITNVPVPGNWYVYAKMESVATRGATGSVACATKHNDEIVDLGDLQLKPAYHLRGRVVLSDGKPVADGMRVTISSENAFDSQTATLPPDGRFEFVGLAGGSYSIFASVKGYSPPPMAPVSFKAEDGRVLTYTPHPPPVSIEHDVDNFVMMLYPDASASASAVPASKPDPR